MKAIRPIAIHNFEERPPHRIAGGYNAAMGYWINFSSEIISGSAILIPSGNGVEELRKIPSPQYITVETGVRVYENFRLLAEDEVHTERSEPLLIPGDYGLVGKVWHVLIEETTGTALSVKVFIGSLGFDLTEDDVDAVGVEEGAWVRFRVRELALYDVNS